MAFWKICSASPVSIRLSIVYHFNHWNSTSYDTALIGITQDYECEDSAHLFVWFGPSNCTNKAKQLTIKIQIVPVQARNTSATVSFRLADAVW